MNDQASKPAAQGQVEPVFAGTARVLVAFLATIVVYLPLLVALKLTEFSLNLNASLRSTFDTLGPVLLLMLTIFVWLPLVRKVLAPYTPAWLWSRPRRPKPQ